MQKRVNGIGAIMFKSGDPEKLRQWYARHLGIESEAWGAVFPWRRADDPQRLSYTVWSPAREDSDYFQPSSHAYMINYQVDDLEGLLEQLRKEGVEVVGGVEESEFGKFAWVLDPEGRKVELWQPRDDAAQDGSQAWLIRQIAAMIGGFYRGPNHTGVSLQDALAGVDWQMATTRIGSLNTIALLVFHINYYVEAVLRVLKGGALDAHDKYSFDMPPVETPADWDQLLQRIWKNADEMVAEVEKLDFSKLGETFVLEKYGNFYKNLAGLLEHSYYHLGQISLLKKLLQEGFGKH